MTQSLHARAKRLFLAALEQPEPEREAFISQEAGDDRELLDEVSALLAFHDDADAGRAAEPAAAEPHASVAAPATLVEALAGRYDIEREIGFGGMATVYRAIDLRHDRPVAVKVLSPEFTSLLGAERFHREIKIVAQLHHPHILQLYDSGEAAGRLFYVMPLVEGGSARNKLKTGGVLPIADAVRILRDVADALCEAHGRGIVHRDIKPDNVLISGRHSLVADFGLAKVVSEVGGPLNLTGTGTVQGTPAYMSPEQVAADPDIDFRTDIYSFGVLAFELLSGRTPFVARSSREMLSAHLNSAPPDLATLRSGLPRQLVSLVMRCLEKDPAKRFQGSDEILGILEDLAQSSGERARFGSDAVRSRLAIWAKRSALALPAVGLVAAVLWYLGRDHAGPLDANRILVSGFVNETGDPGLDHIGAIATDWVSRGLQEAGAAVVLGGGFLDPDPQSPDPEGRTGLAKIVASAESYAAGTVLTGAYYRQGDSVRLQARLVDTRSAELRVSLEPVAGSIAAPIDAVDLLRRRVMSAVDFLSDPSQTTMPIRPPVYEAYREWVAALRLTAEQDFEGAMQGYLRAIALDSSFNVALLMASGMMIAVERFVESDSMLDVLEGRLESLTPLERIACEGQRARLRGDIEGWLEASRRVSEIMPYSPGTQDLAEGPVFLNRPAEAIAFLDELDFSQEYVRGWVQFWVLYHDAHHMLGHFEEALDVASRARALYPSSLTVLLIDIPTLAALGRIDEVNARFDVALARPPQPGVDIGEWMLIAASEFRAHGFPEEAAQVLGRLDEWFQSLPNSESASVERTKQRADALNLEGRHAEALQLMLALAESNADDVDVVGRLGRTAAAAGDEALARRVDGMLSQWDEPYLFGSALAWRARIAGILGERERAVSLLREAFAQGLHGGPWLHRDNSFEPLRGYAPFDALVEPRG